jgi:hypothetical protein
MTGITGPSITGPTGSSAGTFMFLNSGGALTNNNFLLFGLQDAQEVNAQAVMTVATTVKNMTVSLTVAPGVGATRTFTLRKNAANTALTVSITGAATTGSDAVNTVAFAQFDLLAVQHTTAGGPTASRGAVTVQIV